MNVTKALSTAGFGAAVVVGSMLAVNFASAHENGSTEVASELATRFNLDEGEVETFFQEKKAEHQAEREAEQVQRLATLVENETLTQEQADALTTKHEEMRATSEALKDSGATREEIHSQMEESRAEFEAWATEQGIDLDAIRPEKGEGRGHGQGGPRSGHGQNDDSSESTTEES